ncbi:MAG: hypothetical protein J2P19_18870 [Pseudonocardia sp.]|nr:hypothetical protein [Pseudonocardia sp.]
MRWFKRRRTGLQPMEGHHATWFGPRNTTKPPLIQIMESHKLTEESGFGVRECHICRTRWKSVLGSYLDAGKLAKLKPGRDYKVYASWPETIGLTCRKCRRSLCMTHVGKPEPTGEAPQPRDYLCPFCGGRMHNA